MYWMWIALAALVIALIISVKRYRDSNELPPQEPMIDLPEKINGLDVSFVVFDEAEQLRKPKQQKSRSRKDKQ